MALFDAGSHTLVKMLWQTSLTRTTAMATRGRLAKGNGRSSIRSFKI
jgi:hypothetical protein